MSRRWPKDWKPAPYPPVKKKKEDSPVAVDMAKGSDFTSYILAARDSLNESFELKTHTLMSNGRAQGKSSASHALTMQDVINMRDRLMFEPKRPRYAGRESYSKYCDWLRRVKYKKGFTFSVDPSAFQVRLSISMECICVDDGRPTKIHGSWPIEDDLDEYGFLMFVRKQIHDLEIHEADEWLRFDFINVFNPHKRSCHNDFKIEYDPHHSRAQFERTKGEREYRRRTLDERDKFRVAFVDEAASLPPTLYERYPWER